MYHRLRRPLWEIPGSLLNHLPQQPIQIVADEGWFFRDLFHGRKSSGGTKTAGSRSRNRDGNQIFDRRSNVLISSGCQGYSLQLTGARGLVGEGGVEGVMDAFGG